jgi:hypothetical protein
MSTFGLIPGTSIGPRVVALSEEFTREPKQGDTVVVGDSSGRRCNGRVTVVDGWAGHAHIEVTFDQATFRDEGGGPGGDGPRSTAP